MSVEDSEAILDHQVGDTTLRTHRDEWTDAGVLDQLTPMVGPKDSASESLGYRRPSTSWLGATPSPPASRSNVGTLGTR